MRSRSRSRPSSWPSLIGGLVVLLDGREPARRSTRACGSAPASTGRSSTCPGNPFGVDGLLCRDQPDRHARAVDAARADRPRGRLRLPLRPLQHRRPGPVLGRRVRAAFVTRARRSAARSGWILGTLAGARRRLPRAAASPAPSRPTAGPTRSSRTIMLNWIAIYVGAVAVRPRRAAAGRRRRASRTPTRCPSSASYPGVWGAHPARPHRDLHRPRRGRRVLGDHRPHDARLRGAGGRLQPRGGALRRRLGGALDRPGDGDRRRLRRPRRRRARCSAFAPHRGHRPAGLDARLHRHRRRAARPQHRRRHRARRRSCSPSLDSGARFLSGDFSPELAGSLARSSRA